MARAPVSKTGGWGFESLHSCQARPRGGSPALSGCCPKRLEPNADFPRLTL